MSALHLVVNGEKPQLQRFPKEGVLTINKVYPHYRGRLTIGKCNLWRKHVEKAMLTAMNFTMFRKGL